MNTFLNDRLKIGAVKHQILRFFLVLLLVSAVSPVTFAGGNDDFCKAVNVILHDAPNQFRNVRTNIIQTSANSAIYKSGIPVPGVISGRFVANMGNFYEGALCQSRDLKVIKAAYDTYKQTVTECLAGKNYSVSLLDNFYEGLEDYKKIAFMPPHDIHTDYKKLPGHITLEVDYSKDTKQYTLILFIYEH